jgi:arylsulfatase A-like enzyme
MPVMNQYKQKYLLFILLVNSVLPAFTQQQKPNIVWITIEDTSPDFIGCYGNKQAKTPNIDALAAEGVRFTNAHSTNTICSPSRHTIITGIRTAQDGAGHHRSSFNLPSYIKGFAYYVKNGGYFTSNYSKTDYNAGNEKAIIQQNWTKQGGQASFVKREHKTQPFFSVFNIDETHQSRTMTNTYAWFEKNILSKLQPEEIIQPEGLAVPPIYKNNDNNRRNMARLYNAVQAMDKKVGAFIQMIKDAGEWDNTIVFFFADHGQGMPRFKANASRLGTQVPFIIRFPEQYKHLIAAKPGGTFDELVTFEDLAPTMIHLTTGANPPGYLKGRVFLGDKKQATDNIFWGCRDNTDEVIDMGRIISKGDYVYTRVYYPHLPVLQRELYFDQSEIVQQMRFDYKSNNLDSLQASIFNQRSTEYLFNKSKDPWETQNLATDKRYAGVLASMRKMNRQKIIAYQDINFLPDVVLSQINAADTLMVWKKNHYKVQKYLKVAGMVGMGQKYLKRQMHLLDSKDSVVRYWAVVGLLNQPASALNKEILTNVFQKERTDFVKIELADVLYVKFNDIAMLDWTVDLISNSTNSYLVRQAAMKLANNENLPATVVAKMYAIMKTVTQRHAGVLSYAIHSTFVTVTRQKAEEDKW